MQKERHRSVTIRKKLLIPMAAVLILQAVLFSTTLLWGGTIEQLDRNAMDILSERVESRKNYLQNEMIQRWTNLESTEASVEAAVVEVLEENGAHIEQLRVNTPLASQVLQRAAQPLIDALRRNSVTGVYLILNGGEGAAGPEEASLKPALYLRDMDPAAGAEGNADLLVEFAPVSVARALGIPLDTNWAGQMRLPAEDAGSAFYYRPYRAALERPDIGWKDLGYWSTAHRLAATDLPVISYSVPLRDAAGYTYGVLGVELTLDYLRTLMPYDELASGKQGSYLLAVDRGEGVFENVLVTGPAYVALLGDSDHTFLETQELYNGNYRLSRSSQLRQPAVGCVQYFSLYNTNTPFVEERWALLGIMDERDLTGFSRRVCLLVATALLFSLAFGILVGGLAGNLVTGPIVALARKVRESDPSQPVKLEKTRITEIDALADSVEHLSLRVAETSSRLSQILELAKVPIGAFEYERASGTVFYTQQLFRILGVPLGESKSGTMDLERFRVYMEPLREWVELCEEGGSAAVLHLRGEKERWVRIKRYDDSERLLGVATDITGEMLERRKIERERDYDLLTNLYNRRAFSSQIKRLRATPEALRTAALIMLDLDNLKYINDTYGHDVGDDYIRCTAQALRDHTPQGTLLSRMSGDEFHVLFYGYSGKEEVRRLICALQEGIQSTGFALPDGSSLRVRASAGVAWYPDDSTELEELVKFADFAMYKVKNTTKGEFNEFDRATYERDSYLLYSKEELNRLIEEQLVDYHFQPIVDCRDGSVFGYEALMRSEVPSLKNPAEILTLARSQSKLYQIERLTWFKALHSFGKLRGVPEDCRVFINSIANQTLNEGDAIELEEAFAWLLPRVVIELTEDERMGAEVTRRKQAFARRWNEQMALDDFGSGYNGETLLLNITPDFLKIDMSIVQGIDVDENRRKILEDLVSYAKAREIKVVAEGVETRAQLETLVLCGVDYLQGYYLARPSPLPARIPEQALQELAEARERFLQESCAGRAKA